jgi:malonate transporter
MGIVLEIVLPVFALIFIGWLIVKLRWLDEAGLKGLTNYTFYVAFSALLFRAMRNVHLDQLDAGILLAYFSAVAVIWLLAMAIGRFVFGLSFAEQTMMALGGTFTNGVGLGIPLVLATWGEAGLVPLLMIIAVHSAILLSAAAVLVELSRGGEAVQGTAQRLANSLLAALRHPVLLAIAVGLAWGMFSRATGVHLPNWAEVALKWLGESAIPCALIGLGGSLAMIRLAGDLPQTLVMTVCKLVALPLAVWLMAHYVLRLDTLWTAVATVNAAMPTGANVYLLAQRYDTYVARTTSTVLLSTACSIVTLSIVLALFT